MCSSPRVNVCFNAAFSVWYNIIAADEVHYHISLWFLLVFILLNASYQQTPYDEIQRAMAGVSIYTNINIPCNIGRGEEAPFWFINNTAYELFSIPLDFPYIPTVNSFSQLTIPVVVIDLNSTLFQCTSFGEDGLVHRGINVLLIQ